MPEFDFNITKRIRELFRGGSDNGKDLELPNIGERMPAPLKLSEEREQEIIRHILMEIEEDMSDRGKWRNLRTQDLNQYLGYRKPKNFPWPGCSNFHVPITESLSNFRASQIFSLTFPFPDKIISLIPTEKNDEVDVDLINKYINWELLSHVKDFMEIMWSVIFDTTIFGSSIPKVTWERTLEKKTVDERMAEFKETAKGRIPDKTLQRLTKLVATYDGVLVEWVPAENLIIPRDALNVQDADHIGHRSIKTIDYLKKREREGVYQNVDELNEEAQAGADVYDNKPLRQILDEEEGVHNRMRKGEVEIIEWFAKHDIDNDGFKEDMVFTLGTTGTQYVLHRAVFLDDLFAHGRRPFQDFHYERIPGKFWGQGLPRSIFDSQEEINALHNQRLDLGTLQASQPYLYDVGSKFPERTILQPGRGYPVHGNPSQAIFRPPMPANTGFFFQEEMLVKGYIEQRTNITDFSQGRVPSERANMPRTATQTRDLLVQGQKAFQAAAILFQHRFAQMVGDVLALNQQYIAPGMVMRVTGQDGKHVFQDVSKENIQGKYDVKCIGDLEEIDVDFQRQKVSQLYPLLAESPFVQAFPHRRWELEHWLLSTFKHKGIADLIGPKPEFEEPPQTQQEENARMMQGKWIEPLPTHDHFSHMADITEFMESDEYLAVPAAHQPLFVEHRRKHAEFAGSMEAINAALPAEASVLPGAVPELPEALSIPPGLEGLTPAFEEEDIIT